MEVIIVILIIVFVFANSGSKSRKGQAAGGHPAAGARANARKAAARAAQAPQATIPRETPQAEEISTDINFEDAIAELKQRLKGAPAVMRRPEPVAAAAAPRQGESLLDDEDCGGGSMPHAHTEGHSALEDEDCVGGSMEHSHAEGVSRADQARRMAAIDAGYDNDDVLPETIDARALRRAVVMAEVLGKPRALRRGI